VLVAYTQLRLARPVAVDAPTAVGAAPTPAAAVALSGAPRVSAAVVRARLPGRRAETLRMLLWPTQGPGLGACQALPRDQETHQEATHDGQGCLTRTKPPSTPPTSVDGQPSTSPGLNHKLRTGRGALHRLLDPPAGRLCPGLAHETPGDPLARGLPSPCLYRPGEESEPTQRYGDG
jgi:hypothetical protein